MKEAHLYKKLKENKVQCLNCAHYCLIEEGKRGICRTRENQKGKLFALNYRKAVALNVDPIEKKPFFHFLPGTYSLSLASWGCNFKCLNCQNWTISQNEMEGEEISPEQILEIALKNNLPSISYTYTEPAIFSEYALEIMKLARKKKIKNAWVSNGYWSEELFKTISPFLDAANIDLKAFSQDFYLKNCSAKLEPVKETLKRLKKKNIWTEITTLLIPGLNDSEQELKAIARFIKELGPEIPWHITKFSPEISWKLKDVKETPRESLKRAHIIGKDAGLRYVYTGNISGMDSESTFCPKCNTLAVKRLGYEISRYDSRGRCPKCKENLNII
jgi:pyruvate formate lyase activating enzyme